MWAPGPHLAWPAQGHLQSAAVPCWMGQAFRNGPGRTLMGPPAANRCESGPSLPGASAPSLHFSSREKGHRAPHHLGPHRCLVPEWRLSDPDPLSQVSFCILAGDGGTDTVWLNVFLSSLSVWVSVCMTWNKLPTASLSCVPAVPQPRPAPSRPQLCTQHRPARHQGVPHPLHPPGR